MRNIYSLAACLFGMLAAWGQSVELPDIKSATPDVYAFEKNINIPVSHYTGIPSIQVPLHHIEAGNISIPVALSYNAQGIRVEEIATRYGQGWDLQGGGAITRQVKDLADENNYLLPNSQFQHNFVDIVNYPARLYELYEEFAEEEWVDCQPDMFYFSFPGHSGKFFFDQATKLPVLQSFDDLKIEVVNNSPSGIRFDGFVITDTKGTRYYFGKSKDGSVTSSEKSENIAGNYFYQFFNDDASQTTSANYMVPPPPAGPTCKWDLLEIEDIYHNRVVYNYDFETLNHMKRTYDGYMNPTMNPSDINLKRRISRFVIINHTAKFLRSIQFPTGKVELVSATSPRQDMGEVSTLNSTSPRAIEKVNIRDSKGQLAKSFRLDFEYVENPDVSSTRAYFHNQPKKRLFLKTVRQASPSDPQQTLPPYEFVYSDVKLPNRFSNSIDWWGFYNGKSNGNSYEAACRTMSPITEFYLSGREVNPAMSQAGLLKKMIYPTGGSASYEYEGNDVRPPYFMANTLNFFSNPTTIDTISLKDIAQYRTNPGSADNIAEYSTAPFTLTGRSFDLLDGVGANIIQLNQNTPGQEGGSGGSVPPPTGYSTPSGFQDTPFEITIRKTITLGTGSVSLYKNFWLNFISGFDEGTYTMNAKRIKPRTGPAELMAEIRWKKEIIPSEQVMFVGGNRIKKTTLDDGYGNLLNKTYRYTEGEASVSSGMLFHFPQLYRLIQHTNPNVDPGLSRTAFILNANINGFTPAPGNHAGYSNVTEFTDSSDGSYKTDYQFTCSPDEGYFINAPFIPQTDNEWLRGKPERVVHSKLENGLYKKVRQTVTAYNFPSFVGHSWTDPAYRAHFNPSVPQDINEPPLPYRNDKKEYVITLPKPSWQTTHENSYNFSTSYNGKGYNFMCFYRDGGIFNTKSVEETDYLDNGNITRKTEFFYESPHHAQLTRKKETTSEGSDVLETRYEYAPDLGESDLVLQNRLSEPIKTESFRNAELLGTTRAFYRDWDTGAGKMVLPETIKASKGAGILESRVRYSEVDPDNGNPLEVQQENGMKICYVWAYGKSLPVAKIENVAYASIPQSLITDIQAASDAQNYSEATMLQKLANLRGHNALAGATVSTFTHRPLVGMTTATDAKGHRTTYEYDAFNRLKAVRDKDGNLVSENQYHYKNQ